MRAHGDFSLLASENILLTRVSGSWNEEATIEYCRAVKASVPKLAKPWAQLVDARAWDLAVPEAAHHLSELAVWRRSHGMACIAYYDRGESFIRDYAEQYLRAAEVDVPTRFFELAEGSVAWLSDQGFDLPGDVRQALGLSTANN